MKFESEGQSEDLNKQALRYEWILTLITLITGGILVIAGIVLIFLGTHDKGSYLEIANIKYFGSYVGVVVLIIGGILLFKKMNVKIKK